jgi:hypothetical protein
MSIPTLPLKLPDGTDLPPRPTELWREHTGTRLAEHYPQAKVAALELIREGVSVSEVARLVGPMCGKTEKGEQDGMRKIIRGWIISAGIDMTDIARLKAAILRDQALDAASELTPDAKVKDLGSLAMLLTQAHQVERNLGGLPSEIKVTTKLTLADLERMRTAPTPAPIRDVIDVTELPTTSHE